MKGSKTLVVSLCGLMLMSAVLNILMYVSLAKQARLCEQLRSDNARLAARARSLGDPGSGTDSGKVSVSPATDTPLDSRTYAQKMQDIAWIQATRARRDAQIERQVLTSPEMQQAFFAQMKDTLPVHYASLYGQLALTPSQVGRFEEIVAKRFWSISDLVATAVPQGLARDDPAFQALYGAAIRATEEDLMTLLGDAGYRQYLKHEQEAPVQSLAEVLSGRLAALGASLTPEGVAELKEVLIENSTAVPGASGDWLVALAYGGGPKTIAADEVDWPGAMAELQPAYSGLQLEVLQNVARQAVSRRKAREFSSALKAQVARAIAP